MKLLRIKVVETRYLTYETDDLMSTVDFLQTIGKSYPNSAVVISKFDFNDNKNYIITFKVDTVIEERNDDKPEIEE